MLKLGQNITCTDIVQGVQTAVAKRVTGGMQCLAC